MDKLGKLTLLLLALVVLVFASGQARPDFDDLFEDNTAEVATPQPATPRQQWEFKRSAWKSDTAAMNDLGRAGWELVSVTTTADGGVSFAYFKRPLASE